MGLSFTITTNFKDLEKKINKLDKLLKDIETIQKLDRNRLQD